MTLGIIAASFVNLVMSVITQRETGVLKRRRATPVPAASIIAGRALTVIVVALATSFVLLVWGGSSTAPTSPRAPSRRW